MNHECDFKPVRRINRFVHYKCNKCGRGKFTLITNFCPEVAEEIDAKIKGEN